MTNQPIDLDARTRRTITPRWFLAFSFLVLAIHEAHELAHAIAGRLTCGEWPARDFNAWRFAGECSSWWPTAAGPLFSYFLMAVGGVIALRANTRLQWFGVALLFSANPFARMFTAAMGGGDEMVVAQRIVGAESRTPALRMVVLLFVIALCGTACVAAWRAMSGLKRRGLWFTVLLLWPMVLTGVVLFVVGNRLLAAGVLREPVIAGAPLLVILVSAVSAALVAATVRWLRNDSREFAA